MCKCESDHGTTSVSLSVSVNDSDGDLQVARAAGEARQGLTSADEERREGLGEKAIHNVGPEEMAVFNASSTKRRVHIKKKRVYMMIKNGHI